MSRHAIRSAMAPGPTGAASPGVSSGHLVFISAQLPLDLQGEPAGATAAEQAAQALENLAHQLRSTGLSLEDVVSLEIHLVDEADRRGRRRRDRGPVHPPVSRPHALRCTMVARRCAAPGRRHRATLLRDACRETIKPPSPKTISGFLYVAVLLIAVAIAYVAVRALFA